jgi:carnitine O-acetyltransferase
MLSGTEGKEVDCLNLLKKAATAHSSFTKLCQEAKACDRHLYGLSQLLKDGESAGMFKDPLFKTSGSWEISTSNMSHDAYEGFGFGQVVPYGIGCGYGIKADKISFNCTTRVDKKDGSPEKMCQMLSECLLEMQTLAAFGSK